MKKHPLFTYKLIFLIAPGLFFYISCQNVSGEISSPLEGEIVNTTIECKGTIDGLASNEHVWLVVSEEQIPGERLFWPKREILNISRKGDWAVKIFEDGPGTEVAIAIYLVSNSEQQKFESWLHEGARTGSYPGIVNINGIELDRVQKITIK